MECKLYEGVIQNSGIASYWGLPQWMNLILPQFINEMIMYIGLHAK